MDVIALVGPSGTGKSHRALMVARQNKADAIIDDGILIKDNKIIAGHSAKREASKIMAIRRAVFVVPGHAEEVRTAIEKEQPNRILILGTSADIATKAEMAKAQFYRNREGKHIIPVPTIELKPHFSGYLIDPIQSFFKKSSTKRRRLGEKSIVRPIFSYYGRLIIDDAAILSIIKHIAKDKDFDFKASHIHVDHVWEKGEDKGIKVSFEVVLNYGSHIPTMIQGIQKKIKEVVEYMTGMFVHDVDIVVKGLKFK